MSRATQAVLLAAVVVVSMAIGGVGTVMAENHHDGNRANGEEVRAGEDDEQPQYQGNFTFEVDGSDRAPGTQDIGVSMYSEGFSENFTIHRINVTSPHFDFADCTTSNARAFGIDRGNDDSGTRTDESLLQAYKSIDYQEDHILVHFYKDPGLTGSKKNLTVYDQIVARSDGCIDAPKQKGWYRVYGQIFGDSTYNEKTDLLDVDFTNWIYVCDCNSRQEAIEKLGKPPKGSKEAYTATGESGTPTPTPGGKNSPTATRSTPQGTATKSTSQGTTETTQQGTGGTTSTTGTTTGGSPTPTVTPTSGGKQKNGTGGGGGGGAVSTPSPSPSSGNGPGLGAGVAVLALLSAALLVRRRD
jgi:PGF-CTERM protein